MNIRKVERRENDIVITTDDGRVHTYDCNGCDVGISRCYRMRKLKFDPCLYMVAEEITESLDPVGEEVKKKVKSDIVVCSKIIGEVQRGVREIPSEDLDVIVQIRSINIGYLGFLVSEEAEIIY